MPKVLCKLFLCGISGVIYKLYFVVVKVELIYPALNIVSGKYNNLLIFTHVTFSAESPLLHKVP